LEAAIIAGAFAFDANGLDFLAGALLGMTFETGFFETLADDLPAVVFTFVFNFVLVLAMACLNVS
jgi:hypothetical protein